MLDLSSLDGQWLGILRSLGIPARFLGKKNQPCPMCGGQDRYQFVDKSVGLYVCRHCGGGNGFQLLRKYHGWDTKTVLEKLEEYMGQESKPEPEKEKKYDAQRSISEVLANARAICAGDNAGRYLASRGLSKGSPDLLYSPKCFESDTKKNYPAMLGKILTPDGRLASVHRTYLEDGKKANIEKPKKMMPGLLLISGGAIRLGGIHKRIGIAEGIETALAVTEMFSTPCWSVTSAGGMESFVPPAGVEEIFVYGDNDKNYVGQAAAYACAKRLAGSHKVFVFIPEIDGQDWLDYMNETKLQRGMK